MAASLFLSLSDLTAKIISSLSQYFPSSSLSKSSLASKVSQEITMLDRTMLGIQKVLADAEEREIRDESIKYWLFELKQVAYSIEELLEDFNYELQKTKSETTLLVNVSVSREDCDSSKKKQKMISYLEEPSFLEDLLDKMVKVKKELDDISRDRNRLSLREDDGLRRPIDSHHSRGSSSLLDSFKVYGRGNEKDQIINALLESGGTSDNSRGIETISVIGMGGMGKTTLARLVYNDERVKCHFKLKSWVWVSDIYDEVRLTKVIIESINRQPCNLSELDTLQIELKELLVNKMFLLVLDDIWNEDPVRWDTLKKPLLAGAHGSRIIITTRNENVASVMRPKLALHLNGLGISDSWALFCCYAFEGKSIQDAPSSLVTIGKNIVEKSNGVPLVVRILGSLLSPESSEESWHDVLKSDLWELDGGKIFIFPVVKLSYHRLPSPLKPCFAYCASFPKGYRFDRDDLVKVWDALGFIPSDRKNDSVATGISFVDDLTSRSFFQVETWGSNKRLRMHDLIHDLAYLIAGDECLAMAKNNNPTNHIFSRHLRHFYGCHSFLPSNERFVLRSFYSVTELFNNFTRRNTFGSSELIQDNPIEWRNLAGLRESKSLQYLKVLDISYTCRPYLSESIGYFKHLRYLNFSQPKIPKTVCLLYNLQTLQNKGFTEFQFPVDLCRLINLKHLIVPDRNNLISMPAGISRLRDLQTLSVFAVCNGKHGSSLAELKELNNLKGELCITQLDHITGITEAKEACLSKKELTGLTLKWGFRVLNPHVEQVMSYLRPHIGIQTINIDGYMGREFPDWLGDRKFSRISVVILNLCNDCEKLPALGNLPCLKNLQIKMSNLKCIGPEFYGDLNVSFPLLEMLRLHGMWHLEEWWTGEVGANFYPRLVELDLQGCEKLKSFSVVNMPSVKTISLSSCSHLNGNRVSIVRIRGRKNHPRLQVRKWNYHSECWEFI